MIAQLVHLKTGRPYDSSSFEDYDQDYYWDKTNQLFIPKEELGEHQSSFKNGTSVNPKTEIVLYKAAVYVQGDFANRITKTMFYRRGYEIVDDIVLADIVVWTGGSDINPKIYGERPNGAVGWSDRRDADDIAAIEKAKNAFKVGICRGAQLLNCIPNNGSLWQDVDRHVGADHTVTDLITKKVHTVNSLHHQQMRPTDKAEIIATTNLSSVKERWKHQWHTDNGDSDPDIEALFYPETKSLCLQWHPEFDNGYHDSESYCFNLIERYYHAA